MKEEHNLTTYFDIVFRRLGLFLGVFFALALGIFIIGETVRPLYQSSATLLVNTNSPSANPDYLFNPTVGGFSSRPNLVNHMEIIKSRALAQLVLDTLPEEMRRSFLAFAGPDPIAELIRSVSVRGVRDADIIKISVAAPTPELTRTLAQAYVQAYQTWTLERNRADIRAVREFIATQLQRMGSRLDSTEKALETYKRSTGTADLSVQAKAVIERQSTVIARYQQTSAELTGLKKELALLQSSADSTLPSSSTGATIAELPPAVLPVLSTLTAELNRLENERTNLLLQGYDSISPRLTLITRRQNELRQQIAATVTQVSGYPTPTPDQALNRIAELIFEITRLEAQEQVLREKAAEYETELARLPEAERQLARLTRDVDVARQVHSLLELKYEEARIQEAGRLSAVGLIDAPGPVRKIRPSHLKNALTAVLASLVFAFGATLLAERLDTLVRQPEDIERRNWTVLGFIPRMQGTDILNPGESAIEQFRVLRTNLQFLNPDRPLKTIVISSPSPSEGKSTVAANLTSVLAQSGKKTLLIDCDLRKPRLHKIFNGNKKPGLTDVVLLNATLATAIHQTTPDAPAVLFAGTTPPSPVDFLTSGAFQNFLAKIAAEYDYIVIDTPPILVAADAVALTTKSDGVLLVTRVGQTDIRALAEARKLLNQAQAKILGVVANGIKPRRHYGYYRYKYRYYHYRYANPA